MAYRLVTFDVYSALFDVEASLVPRLRAACGPGADALAIARTWRAKQLEQAQVSNSLQRGRVPFRELTARALDYAIRRAGLSLDAGARHALLQAWDELEPWPEAPAALAELRRRGYRLALLSNGDTDMLRALAARMPGGFEEIYASDMAGHYKPHPALYGLPIARQGLTRAEILHVAGAAGDVIGASYAGLACAWSNRAGDILIDPAVRATHEMRDLTGLLEVL